jgi:hypothetical protein
MKFFTAILSALALALALAFSTTSATPIASRSSSPLSNTERQLDSTPVVNHRPGDSVTFTWNPNAFPNPTLVGDYFLQNVQNGFTASKLFSLPPPPRAPVASTHFPTRILNLCATSPFSGAQDAATVGWHRNGHNTGDGASGTRLPSVL